ncbi:MAG TPA: hypothetical protein VIU14_09635 [Mesorhizobium sp.]
MRKFAPDPAALSETLERILASDTFGRSERARNLLRYLVVREQAGEADRLKGFAIAVDVFGKDSEFDPSTDAQVRVQAGRLRDLLAQYFSTEGAKESFRITIPRGSYVPTYAPQSDMQPTPEPASDEAIGSEAIRAETAPAGGEPVRAPPEATRRGSVKDYISRQFRLFMVAIAVVIAMLGFVAFRALDGNDTDPDTLVKAGEVGTNTVDEVETLPNLYLKVSGGEAVEKVGSLLRNAISGFDTVVFVAREAPDTSTARPLDFVVDVSPGPEAHSIDIALENLKNGQVVTSRLLTADQMKADHLDDEIADFITATMPVSGAVYGYLEKHSLQHGLAKCLLLNDDYYLDQSAEKHKLAYQCFEKLKNDGVRSPLIYSEMASLCLEAVTDAYDYPPGATREKALELARQGVQMAPTSPYAHRAYGFIYTGLGSRTESVKWMKKAYELDPYDLSMAAAYGYAQIMAGDYAHGTPVMSRAVSASSARPSWWDYSLFLGNYMLGLPEAGDAVDSLGTTKRPHYIAARLLAARVRGDLDLAGKLKADLIEKHKNFAANPRETYEKAGYPKEMADKLVDGLLKAGLIPES